MLELRNVTYTVLETDGRPRDILKDFHLQIEKGSFVAVTGPNGSGKSTLARLIMGIDRPTSGRLFFQGQDITDLSIQDRARLGIGFAFQQPIRFKGLQVRDLVRFAAGRALSITETCDYLSQVGLCAMDYVYREMDDSLSGGEMKRIEIAMLMARGVRLSVFDEPEAGIDLWSFHNLIHVFENLRQQTQGTILVISHQERILEITDRVLVIDQGGVIQDGPPAAIVPGLLLDADVCQHFRGKEPA